MTLLTALTHYGYWLLFGWSFIEGEIGLILSGILIKEQVFDLQTVLIIAISGAYLGDLTAFLTGRWAHQKAQTWLQRYPKTNTLANWIEQKGIWIIFIERYLYGTHVPILLLLGIKKFPLKTFLFLDFFAVAIWATVYVSIGYLLGRTAQQLIETYQNDYLAISLLFALLIAFWIIFRQSKH